MNPKVPEITSSTPESRVDMEYHSNDKPESRTRYVNGEKHGLTTYWGENGKKESQETWKGGKQHGLKTGWDESGTKQSEKMWKNDGEFGLSVGWYESGAKWWESTSSDEYEQHGAETYWWESGGKKQESFYFDGEKYAQIEWDEEGKVTEVNFPQTTTKPIPKLNTSHITQQHTLR